MHFNQTFINWFIFLWSSLHDFLYAGLILGANKLYRIWKKIPNPIDRIEELEQALEEHIGEEIQTNHPK